MLTVNTQFEYELAALIAEEKKRIQGVLGAGKLKDLGDYRDYCGQLAGLERVETYFEEVNTKLSKR